MTRGAAGVAAILFACAVAAQGVAKPFTHTIPPRGIAEECFKLPGGQAIGYAFEVSAPVDFNIHFHRGNDVEYPVQRNQVGKAEDRFTAPSAENYCLMWTNGTSDTVTVNGRLSP